MALTKFNFNSFDVTTAASSALAFNSSANGFDTAAAGSMTLIKTTTASNVGNVDLTHGSNDVVLDGTYDTYLFYHLMKKILLLKHYRSALNYIEYL